MMNRIVPILVLLCVAMPAATGVARAGDETPPAAGPAAASATATADTAATKDTSAGEFDQAPTPVKTVAPVYPPAARKRGQEGTVYLRARVTTAGRVERVTVAKGVAPDLDEAAARALRQWTFEPARKDGKPVAAEIMIPVKFRLAAK